MIMISTKRTARGITNSSKNKKFLAFIYIHMQLGWSIEVCVERAVKEGQFRREEIVCTKTLYNMIAKGLLDIKSCDLPEKMQRKKNKKVEHHPRPNLRKMGRSIEERDKAVFERKEIGHRELDTVRGARGGRDTLVTFIERKTRFLIVLRVHYSKSNVVVGAIRDYINSFGAFKSKIFKTITTDNGSEFSTLPELEKELETLIYLTHPYSAYEKGTNERHNRLIRRHIHKGKKIEAFTDEYICKVQNWCNTLPGGADKNLDCFLPYKKLCGIKRIKLKKH